MEGRESKKKEIPVNCPLTTGYSVGELQKVSWRQSRGMGIER